jgi:hypothetical protein
MGRYALKCVTSGDEDPPQPASRGTASLCPIGIKITVKAYGATTGRGRACPCPMGRPYRWGDHQGRPYPNRHQFMGRAIGNRTGVAEGIAFGYPGTGAAVGATTRVAPTSPCPMGRPCRPAVNVRAFWRKTYPCGGQGVGGTA